MQESIFLCKRVSVGTISKNYSKAFKSYIKCCFIAALSNNVESGEHDTEDSWHNILIYFHNVADIIKLSSISYIHMSQNLKSYDSSVEYL